MSSSKRAQAPLPPAVKDSSGIAQVGRIDTWRMEARTRLKTGRSKLRIGRRLRPDISEDARSTASRAPRLPRAMREGSVISRPGLRRTHAEPEIAAVVNVVMLARAMTIPAVSTAGFSAKRLSSPSSRQPGNLKARAATPRAARSRAQLPDFRVLTVIWITVTRAPLTVCRTFPQGQLRGCPTAPMRSQGQSTASCSAG